MADPRKIYPLDISEFAPPKGDPFVMRGYSIQATAMLATARENAIRECVDTLRKAENSTSLGHCIESLQALLTPKTKEVEVWSVEYAVKEGGRWVPAHSSVLYENKADAEEIANNKSHGDCAFVKVTGPFMRTVPAD